VDGGRAFRVFVGGDSWRSQRVVQALHDLCAAHGVRDYEVEVIDLAEHPQMAEQHGVLALPMVMRVSPGPPVRVIGDLRDAATAADVLGLTSRPGREASADAEEGPS
jgi:circadian clock protein KaiB